MLVLDQHLDPRPTSGPTSCPTSLVQHLGPDVVSITVYDRHMLLKIGFSVAQRKPDFEFLNALFTDTALVPFVWAAWPARS